MTAEHEVRTEDLGFYSGPGLKLSARMYWPASEPPFPGVVFCHGFGGTKEGTPPGLATLLAWAGYAVLTFDYRGFGGSEGVRGWVDPPGQIEDACHALDVLAARSEVDERRLALYGTSFGGGNAVAAAVVCDLPVRAVVATVPVTDGDAWLRAIGRYHEYVDLRERAKAARRVKALSGKVTRVDRYELMIPDPLTVDYYAPIIEANPQLDEPVVLESVLSIVRHRPVAYAAELDVPLRVIAAGDDRLIPIAQAQALLDACAAPERDLHVLPGASHFSVYEKPGLSRVADLTTAWLRAHVGDGREHARV